jgi:hypothetical protein
MANGSVKDEALRILLKLSSDDRAYVRVDAGCGLVGRNCRRGAPPSRGSLRAFPIIESTRSERSRSTSSDRVAIDR